MYNMIGNFLEACTDETNLAPSKSNDKRPTLKQVQKQLKGFDEPLIMYVYHKMNGRLEEAESYLREWEEEQEEIKEAYAKKISEVNVNECNAEHDSPVADGDAEK